MSKPKTIFRVGCRHKPYSQLSNAMLRDQRLTMEQRGILACILSHADSWEFTFSWLKTAADVGTNKAREIISALEAAGYCRREQQRGERGRLSATVYVFTDDPEPVASPSTENRVTVEADRCTPIGGTVDRATVPGHNKEKEVEKNKSNKTVHLPSKTETLTRAAQSRVQIDYLGLEGKVKPAIPEKLMKLAEGFGFDVPAMAAKHRAPAAFKAACIAELERRLPGVRREITEPAMAGNPNAKATLYALLSMGGPQ